jgi:hypothetical protein
MELENSPSDTDTVIEDTESRSVDRGVPEMAPVCWSKLIHSGCPVMEKSKESPFASDASGVKLKDSPIRMDDTEPEIVGAVFTGCETVVLPPPQPAKTKIPRTQTMLFLVAMLAPRSKISYLNRKLVNKRTNFNYRDRYFRFARQEKAPSKQGFS